MTRLVNGPEKNVATTASTQPVTTARRLWSTAIRHPA